METENDHEDGARASDFADYFIPRHYNKEWPPFAVQADADNKKHKRNRGPNAVKKLTEDLNKMKMRVDKEKTKKGGKKKYSKSRRKLRRKKLRKHRTKRAKKKIKMKKRKKNKTKKK